MRNKRNFEVSVIECTYTDPYSALLRQRNGAETQLFPPFPSPTVNFPQKQLCIWGLLYPSIMGPVAFFSIYFEHMFRIFGKLFRDITTQMWYKLPGIKYAIKVTRSSAIAAIARVGGHYSVQCYSRSPISVYQLKARFATS